MRQFILIGLIIMSGHVYAIDKTAKISDSILLTYNLDAVDQLLFNSYAEKELKLIPNQIQKLSAQQRITYHIG